MEYAIFESGGKQFKAIEGNYVAVDHLPLEEGKKVSFDRVLLLVNEQGIQVGTPYLKDVSVDTTVVNHFKGEKVVIFKYRPKKRYRVKKGHRQEYTRLRIDNIIFLGKQPKTVAEKPGLSDTETAKPVEKKATKAKSTEKRKAATSATKTVAKGKTETRTEKKQEK